MSLGANTKLFLSSGNSPAVCNLSVGDSLMYNKEFLSVNNDQKIAVLKIVPRICPMVRIDFKGIDSVECSQDHVHVLFKRNSGKFYLSNQKRYYKDALKAVSVRSFEHKFRGYDPYTVGIWTGYQELCSRSRKDPNLSAFLEFSNRFYEKRNVKRIITIEEDFLIYNYVLNEFVKHKSKFIPERYKYANYEIRKEFLTGFLDSSKCLKANHITRPIMHYRSVSSDLIKDLVFVANSLGFRGSVQQSPNASYPRLCISGNFCDLDFRSELAELQAEPLRALGYYGGISSPIGEGVCYDIETDSPNRIIVLGNFLLSTY
jgi:hypothetical protein